VLTRAPTTDAQTHLLRQSVYFIGCARDKHLYFGFRALANLMVRVPIGEHAQLAAATFGTIGVRNTVAESTKQTKLGQSLSYIDPNDQLLYYYVYKHTNQELPSHELHGALVTRAKLIYDD